MSFEKQQFGDGSNPGSGNVTLAVSNHYGARLIGGAQGVVKTEGGVYTSVVDFDATGPIYDSQSIPAGAVVKNVQGYGLTGSISAATVGATNIAAARQDDDTTFVTIATAGDLTVTGPTAGRVVVTWEFYG